MKTIKLTLALCALVTLGRAQLTGQGTYGHNGVVVLLSSGTFVSTGNQGFLMAGYVPSVPAGSPNFYVDRVDDDGTFSSTLSFSREYYMSDGGLSCTAAMTQETNCYGVTAIQSSAGVIDYALAAVFDNGVAFGTLNNTGGVVSSAFYPFPGVVTPNGKAQILRGTNGAHYICGSYASGAVDYMYLFEVTASGGPGWSVIYDLGVSTFKPYSMVEDNYPGFPELAIVGTVGTTTTDGFIITVDIATGAPVIQKALASGQTVNESIYSIDISNAVNGYILGGSTYMNSGPGRAWMTRMFSNASFDWSSRIDPSTNTGAGDVINVKERKSPFYGAYEYYGLTVSSGSNGGMMVLKLDNAGAPFSQPGNTNNEFVYNDGSGQIATPVSMSLLDIAGNNNEGLHVFGINSASNPEFFLNQSFYNGATGTCLSTSQQNLTTMVQTLAGPTVTYNFNVTVQAGLSQCSSQSLVDTQITYAPTQPCSFNGNPSPPGPYTGDNSRPAVATGISENTAVNAAGISVYPNPANAATEVRYNTNTAGDVTITLSDVLGREIKTLASGYQAAGENVLSMDLSALNLESGVYFINVNASGSNNQVKVLYTKN